MILTGMTSAANVPRKGAGAMPLPGSEAFLRDVLAGLCARPRTLPSRWFYDDRGSLLFQRIMDLPEYYLTRSEEEVFERHASAMVAPMSGRPCTVVDLGAGDGAKTRLLLGALRNRVPDLAYVPVDVSRAALNSATKRMLGAFPDLRVVPLEAEYVHALHGLDRTTGRDPRLVLFLGSNIGNLEWSEATAFVRTLRLALRAGDHLLVGFDLMKDPKILRPAYDDAAGVTAAFNLNLLARMNAELGADFDLSSFAHRATFDPVRPAMESWIVSLRRQVVSMAGRRFAFGAGEAIHTEISYKYTSGQIASLARATGFQEVGRFHDDRAWFADVLWRASAVVA